MLLALILLLAWCVVPLPLALAVGRAFRRGSTPPAQQASSYTLAA